MELFLIKYRGRVAVVRADTREDALCAVVCTADVHADELEAEEIDFDDVPGGVVWLQE